MTFLTNKPKNNRIMKQFNHSEHTVYKAIGISEERAKELVIFANELTKTDKISQSIEQIIDNEDLSEVERLYVALNYVKMAHSSSGASGITIVSLGRMKSPDPVHSLPVIDN